MNAISEQFPHASPAWDHIADTRDPKTPGVVTIALTINGVDVPDPVRALTNVINRELARVDELATARVHEIIAESGLTALHDATQKLHDTFENLDSHVRDKLRAAGMTFWREGDDR